MFGPKRRTKNDVHIVFHFARGHFYLWKDVNWCQGSFDIRQPMESPKVFFNKRAKIFVAVLSHRNRLQKLNYLVLKKYVLQRWSRCEEKEMPRIWKKSLTSPSKYMWEKAQILFRQVAFCTAVNGRQSVSCKLQSVKIVPQFGIFAKINHSHQLHPRKWGPGLLIRTIFPFYVSFVLVPEALFSAQGVQLSS